MSKEIKKLSTPQEVSMADEWFDLANSNHFWMEWRFQVIKNKLKKYVHLNSEMKFLEIGCGHGQFLKQCEGILSSAVDGCDLNIYALEKISDVKGDIYVYNIHDKNEQMLSKYDGIFLLDVVEHINDDVTFLNDAIEHLKPGGLIVINVPALQLLFSKYDIVAGHKRRYSKDQINALLISCGIRPFYVGYWGFTLVPIAIVRKLILLFVQDNKVIDRGFNPRNSVINWSLKMLMKFELLASLNFKTGTSLIAIGYR